MSITFEKITAPASWASYLINGDDSGLPIQERMQCDAWLTRQGIRRSDFVNCEEESRFTWSMGVYAPELGVAGGDVLEYTYQVRA